MGRSILILTCLVASAANAGADNIALGKAYAYFGQAPGENPGSGPYYLDDGYGVTYGGAPASRHAVHQGGGGLGAFSTGQLADGIVQDGSSAAASLPTSPVVALLSPWGSVVFDLGGVFSLDSVELGTHRYGGFANFRPENVNLSFATTGYAPGDFGAAILWDVPTNNSDGHVAFTQALGTVTARYVKFDFGTPGQPTLEVHIDEIGIYGSAEAAPVPEPATLLLLSGGLTLAAVRRWRSRAVRPPK